MTFTDANCVLQWSVRYDLKQRKGSRLPSLCIRLHAARRMGPQVSCGQLREGLSAKATFLLAPFVVRSPSTTFSPEMLPTYQAQTADLKNAVSNAALIGSILGQLFFGFAGDILGRKWCFFITSALIILGENTVKRAYEV